MLASGSALRHIQREIEWLKLNAIGIDLSDVRSEADLTGVLCAWIEIMGRESPAIIDTFAAVLDNRDQGHANQLQPGASDIAEYEREK